MAKGKGKKVLRAHIKKYIEDIYNAPEKIFDVTIVYIKRFESLNPNNIWDKEAINEMMKISSTPDFDSLVNWLINPDLETNISTINNYYN